MAVPHAVGAASLLWQKNLNKSADFIESLLKASSKTVVNDEEGYSFIDLEYADAIYDEFSKKYQETDNSIDVEKAFDNKGVVEDCSDEVEGSWYGTTHKETVDYSYNMFNAYYNDVPIVKLGATAPDDYCPFGQYPSHEMFHAKSKYAEHNYVRVCEYIMNLATHCRIYGHQSALSANCKPDSVNDPDYNTVKSWLGPTEITVMLNNQFSYNDYNAALIMFGVAIHVMGDTYAHQALEVAGDGSLEKPNVNDVDSNSRLYYAKQSIMNLWTNFYNNIKTNGTDYEGNGNKFKLKKLYSYSISSTNGKSQSWSAFNDLKRISCRD